MTQEKKLDLQIATQISLLVVSSMALGSILTLLYQALHG